MLIITRKAGESFFLGEDIEIIILDAQDDRVKIGINAPRSVEVARSELREVRQANVEAASSGTAEGLGKNIFTKKEKNS